MANRTSIQVSSRQIRLLTDGIKNRDFLEGVLWRCFSSRRFAYAASRSESKLVDRPYAKQSRKQQEQGSSGGSSPNAVGVWIGCFRNQAIKRRIVYYFTKKNTRGLNDQNNHFACMRPRPATAATRVSIGNFSRIWEKRRANQWSQISHQMLIHVQIKMYSSSKPKEEDSYTT